MSNGSESVKQLIEQVAGEAEAAKDEPYPPDTTFTRPGHVKSVMLSVRLNPEELAALQDFAREREVPASSLVRGWILQHLAAAGETPTPTSTTDAIERIEQATRALRRLAAS